MSSDVAPDPAPPEQGRPAASEPAEGPTPAPSRDASAPKPRPRLTWRLVVPVVTAGAGIMFAMSFQSR
jgi:hypothetical protein